MLQIQIQIDSWIPYKILVFLNGLIIKSIPFHLKTGEKMSLPWLMTVQFSLRIISKDNMMQQYQKQQQKQ